MRITLFQTSFKLLLLAAAMTGGSCAPARAGAETAVQPTKEVDFRTRTFRYSEEIDDEKLSPIIDQRFLLSRLDKLLTPVGPWALNEREGSCSLHPTRPLTYHVVFRYETPDKDGHFIDIDLPSENSPSEQLQKGISIFQDALQSALTRLTNLGGIVPEKDGHRADLLIHINLAERLQASRGFAYETMTPLVERSGADEARRDLRVMEYVLPWTFVRLYFHWSENCKAGSESKRSIEGGEIWIQYPRRTFWQAEAARLAFENPEIAARLGFDGGVTNRRALVRLFRVPHRTLLQPLVEALAPSRPQTWNGAGGAMDLRNRHAARPNETLLSFAMGQLQPLEGAIYELRGPQYFCGEGTHSRALAGRLEHAITMFVGGFEAGAVRVSPLGDYTAEFERDRDSLLADLSLADHTGNFDQRLDDHLVAMAIEETHSERTNGAALGHQALSLSVVEHVDELKTILRNIATEFTPDGGGCLDRVTN